MIFDIYTTARVPTAKKCAVIPGIANLVVVGGIDGSSNSFCDVVLCGSSVTTPTVISSKTIQGSPTARTYSMGTTFQMSVAMASGTYTIRTYGIGAV